LMIGGFEKVYEIGRNLRNEGADATHNPEFTMLEAYEAYGDYNSIGTMTRSLIVRAAMAGLGGTILRRPDGTEHDIGADWPSVTVHDAVSAALGEEVTPDTGEDQLRKLAGQAGISLEPSWNAGQVLLELYEHLVEATTVLPTFYRDFPVEVAPLTRQHRQDPRLAEKWDLVAFGAEIGTGYSELVDPLVQRARLTAQSLLAAGGDHEAMQLDEDFLRALEYGMPPSGGMGMGIDRVLIMFTGASIRETILFPIVKPS
jgi:lysyl-tRNA synthetase class 2